MSRRYSLIWRVAAPVGGLLAVATVAAFLLLDLHLAVAWAALAVLILVVLTATLRHEMRALRDLADATGDMAAGNLERDVDCSHAGEIGAVARGLVDMRDAIGHRLDELRESESRYRKIFDAMADGLLLVDQDGAVVAANPRVATTYGWSLPRLVGRPVATLLRDEDRELAQALRSPPADRPLSIAGITCDREGRELETEIGAMRLVFQGRPHALIILRVVAEQRRLERQLQQSQKLESVGRLAGGIAHDFNNLLTPVLGYTEMLLAENQLDAQARADIEIIRHAGERARNLARQLLAFSRRQVLEMRDIELDRVVADCEPLLRRTLREDIELVVAAGGDGGHVHADAGQLEQVLMNLAINAMDAMSDGGRLEVATERITLGASDLAANPDLASGEYLRLRVRDTGVGVPEAILERVVEPFFTTKRSGKGTGLGLATIHGIVQQHGGRFTIGNHPHGGCLVEVDLPRLTARAEADDIAVANGVPEGRGETVILVEDDDMVRVLVERLLTQHGYKVRSFATGDACLDALQIDPVPADILLTDVIMPGLSGPDLRDRLHAAGLLLPALFMSGYTGDILLRRGLGEARADFLQKPVAPPQLLRKLRGMLERAPRR